MLNIFHKILIGNLLVMHAFYISITLRYQIKETNVVSKNLFYSTKVIKILAIAFAARKLGTLVVTSRFLIQFELVFVYGVN